MRISSWASSTWTLRKAPREYNSVHSLSSRSDYNQLRRLPAFIAGKKTPMRVFLPAVSGRRKISHFVRNPVRGSPCAEAGRKPMKSTRAFHCKRYAFSPARCVRLNDPLALCKNPQERKGAHIPKWCAGLPPCLSARWTLEVLKRWREHPPAQSRVSSHRGTAVAGHFFKKDKRLFNAV